MPDAMPGSFNKRVYAVVRSVPEGWVTTYGDVAAAIGHPRAARQVGWAMARAPEGVPWHRVINARGMISGRGDFVRVEEQRAMLEGEGIVFDDAGRCDLRAVRWPFADHLDG